MGASVSASSPFLYKSKTTPDWENPPTVDSQYGFEGQRKERGKYLQIVVFNN